MARAIEIDLMSKLRRRGGSKGRGDVRTGGMSRPGRAGSIHDDPESTRPSLRSISWARVDAAPRIRFIEEAIMRLKVLLRPESAGGYSVSVPALPGCYSQGETREEAMENIREAAELWLEVAADTAAARAEEEETDAELQEIEL
jgi:predicted RNase H-like HicB family nuclease